MDITSTLPADPRQPARRPPARRTRPRGPSGLNSDFNTFLRMLTTQMQNQDPLNPLNSSDFAVQLATFSQVEQQVRTNDLLTTLGSQMAVMGMSQLASWVGMEARVSAPVTPSGAPIELAYQARSTADSATLVVTNTRGNEVQRIAVDPNGESYDWPTAGLPGGSYSVSLESYAGDTLIGTDPVDHYARINEARSQGGSVVLLLEFGRPGRRLGDHRDPQSGELAALPQRRARGAAAALTGARKLPAAPG